MAPVETTKLSSKGQVIIPKHIRESHRWDTGLELQVIEFDGDILLKPKAAFEQTTIDDVAGCLHSIAALKNGRKHSGRNKASGKESLA
ncbi:MAG: AbrB/MazE/SpoVT family DNA-binding domain-containing protein [Candidatus Competibacteraceae bacterium]|nr:AbrB/MazE/SpoVT family DNA-binding domain-containing protein [Candidatus Competibacteraceae bacterium]MBK9951230.1 AbrB/MazE/SpoVT family DNA-binding domain-containing protein [Candidatus Competibacteraceae bacterium]